MSVPAIQPLDIVYGFPMGRWRWVALACVVVALVGAGLAVGSPMAAGWPGAILLAGVGATGALFLYAIWPRPGTNRADTRRVAIAAARANIAWAITGPNGIVSDCNNAYRRMVGIGEKEIPPPPELALAVESRSDALYRLARCAAEGKNCEETFKLRSSVELTAAVRPLGDGQSAWWFTPLLSGVQSAAESEKLSEGLSPSDSLPTLFRDAPVGIAMTDEAGVVIEANKSFAEFFDNPANLLGASAANLAETGDREAIAQLIENIGKTNPGAIELRYSGESERMAELYASPLATGESKRIILYLIDISEQKQLELKFAQSQKLQAVGQLAGGVAHDFNNLLTVIIGNSEFLLMRHQASDPSFKEINEIHQTALRAATLVGQLLAFSRKQTLQPRTLNLADVVSELSIMLRRLLREGVELKLEPAAGLWTVHADEAQISNALINLVVNARDAMPKGGTVTIRTANETTSQPSALGTAIMPANDYVRIDVADTGTGISKDNLGKIFDPFFTTKPVGQGTGLGLATVYGIVKQTGGYITVESDFGAGTTFRIYLPRYRAEEHPAPLPEAIVAAPRDVTGHDTILLVEDEKAVRSFAARALRLRGYEVLEAEGGEEALEIVRSQGSKIHLLITDVVMPNMDGPTLARAVRRTRPDMRIIFMSGYAEEAFRRNDEKAEDLHFLPKPFGLKQLAAKVKEVLSGTPPPAAR